MTSLLMSSSPISILHRLFQCRYSNSRDVVSSSPSFPPPRSAARAPRRACSQARTGTVGHTQGAKGFSCAVSGVLKSDPREKLYLFSRGFAARVFGLRPTKRSCPSHARKKPLVPRVSRSLRVLLCGRFRVRFGPRCVF